MKLFYNVFFITLLSLFGLACDESPDDPETPPDPAAEAPEDPAQVAAEAGAAQAKYAPAQQFLVQFPCPATASEELAGLCKGEGDSKVEELFVVYQSAKDQSSEVVLVAQYEEGGIVGGVKGSARSAQSWINRVLGSSPGHKRRFCEAEQSAQNGLLQLSAAVSVIAGVQSTHLTGGVSMRGDNASRNKTNAQGYVIKSVNKDQSGQVTGVTLTKDGSDVVAAKVAGSEQASSLALGQYADFIQELKAPNLCETLSQPAQPVSTTPAPATPGSTAQAPEATQTPPAQ